MTRVEDNPLATRPPRDFKLIRGGVPVDVDPEATIPGAIVATIWDDAVVTTFYRIGGQYYKKTMFRRDVKETLRSLRYILSDPVGFQFVDDKELHRLELATLEEEANSPA